MNRKLLVSKLRPAYVEMENVWSQTYRYQPNPDGKFANAGICEWYLRLRFERSYLSENFKTLIRGLMPDEVLPPFAERLVTFCQILVQFDDVVVTIQCEANTLLDLIEDLNASL
jgi:hypothetical protein